jgi:hypothetical protein
MTLSRIALHRAAVVGALVLVTALVFAQPRRDGNWEVKMEMAMEGMPQAMPPMTMTQCVTPAEAEDPQKMVPQGPGRGMNSDCKMTDYKFADGKASWTMTCGGANPMTGTGEFVYTENSYTGTMKMTMSRGGGPAQTMTMKYSGKRLGDCVK